MGMMGPGAPFGVEPATGMPYSDKSKTAAGVLNILLPGVGRLYTGHIGIGIAQIAVTLFTCLGWLWPVIDGVMMLTGRVTDAEGRPLRP
jgi:TM2 domain-containing membrane protein YozV